MNGLRLTPFSIVFAPKSALTHSTVCVTYFFVRMCKFVLFLHLFMYSYIILFLYLYNTYLSIYLYFIYLHIYKKNRKNPWNLFCLSADTAEII